MDSSADAGAAAAAAAAVSKIKAVRMWSMFLGDYGMDDKTERSHRYKQPSVGMTCISSRLWQNVLASEEDGVRSNTCSTHKRV
jgi:hypothetical protein